MKTTEYHKQTITSSRREIVGLQKGEILPEVKEVKLNEEEYMNLIRQTKEREENDKALIESLSKDWINTTIKPVSKPYQKL